MFSGDEPEDLGEDMNDDQGVEEIGPILEPLGK